MNNTILKREKRIINGREVTLLTRSKDSIEAAFKEAKLKADQGLPYVVGTDLAMNRHNGLSN